MGAIHTQASSLYGALSDAIGVKSGLALTIDEIQALLSRAEGDEFQEFIGLEDDQGLRIDSVTYERLFEHALYAVGRLESPRNLLPMATVYHKYKADPVALGVVEKVSDEFVRFLEKAINDPSLASNKAIDPSPFMHRCMKRYGRLGLDISYDLFSGLAAQNEIRSAIWPGDLEWTDVAQLKDLFDSEGLEAQFGRFIDQRYVDYLHRNPDDLDRMNWRKFEGLTAEYFHRLGFSVEIGPGRNDGGIDIRVWPAENDQEAPPSMIIQCKRQRQSVSKVIVKSLYADVLDFGAGSGLIVTTSKLSPGARDVCRVRNYPIGEADRSTLRKWIGEMRKPGVGVAT